MYPSEYLYSREHEWVRVKDDVCVIGITVFAQQELGEVVFVELPEVGQVFDSGDEVGTIESVKAVAEVYTPLVPDGFNLAQGIPRVIDGFRLVDARASYGIGVQTMALGMPLHFDWSWRTLFNREWEDALFAAYGGTNEFRDVKFSLWIGYDF